MENKNPRKYYLQGLSLAEKERFELSKPFWGLHDFQSCALDQARRLLRVTLQICVRDKMLNDCIIFVYLCQQLKTPLM